MLCRFIPEDLWIPGVVCICLAVAVKDRVTCKAGERNSVVGAVGNALHLLMRETVESCVHQHERIFSPPGIIVAIDEARTGPSRAELVDHESGGQFPPV